MKYTRVLLLAAAALTVPALAPAQTAGPYLGASFSYAALEEPFGSELRLAFDPVLSVGYNISDRHALEVSASRIAAEQVGSWESAPAGGTQGAEAPYTIGFHATPVTFAYRHRVPLADGMIQPFADFGVVWARVVDYYESDTPREQRTSDLLGGSVHVGAQWSVTHRLSLLASVGYRRFREHADRPVRAFTLASSLARMGLQFRL